MPLEHNSSKEAFEHNLKAELAADKPLKQALAIAYQIKRNDDLAQVKHLARKIARGDCADSVRNDADKWITVNSGHGEGGGTPALIGEDGTVKGGMGGKFNGLNIKDAHSEGLKARETKKAKDAEHHGKLTAGTDAPIKSKTANLAKEIQKLGGINLSHAKDIIGDNPSGEWKFAFSKDGQSIDDLATQLKDKGFDIDTSAVDGGVQQLRDMIRDHSEGQAEFKHGDITNKADQEKYYQERDSLQQKAEKKGIKITRNMTASQINAALDYHAAREESDSLGIKTNAKMSPDEIYKLVEQEMMNRADQAQQEMLDRHNSKLAKQIEIEQAESSIGINPESLSIEEFETANKPEENEKESFVLTGQTNAEINEQEAKKAADIKQQKENEQIAAKEKHGQDVEDFKARLKTMADNPDNFKFGEDGRAASNPMGSLFA